MKLQANLIDDLVQTYYESLRRKYSNATFAASATQMVNLTAKHISNDDVIWQETQISDFNIGQALVTIISTDDTMIDFEIIDYTTTNKFGETQQILSIVIISFIILVHIQMIKRKKLKELV